MAIPAWTGAPLNYAQQKAREQAYKASLGLGGSLAQAAADDWFRETGEDFRTGSTATGGGTTTPTAPATGGSNPFGLGGGGTINTGPPNITLPFPTGPSNPLPGFGLGGGPVINPGPPNITLPFPGATTPTAPTTPGVGGSQLLSGFGIPGFETGSLAAGPYSSWAGTVFGPAAAPNFYNPGLHDPQIAAAQAAAAAPTTQAAPIAGAPGAVNFNDPYAAAEYNATAHPMYSAGGDDPKPMQGFDPITGAPVGTANPNGTITTGTGGTIGGFAITPPRAYDTSRYLQTYGGKLAPYANIHEQLGAAFTGTPVAMPGFQWASPQGMAGIRGMAAPGGWAAMLGFTPGGSV